MDKYFAFKSETPLPFTAFQALIAENYQHPFRISMVDRHKGYIVSDAALFDTLNVLVPLFNSDLGLVLTFVVAHQIDVLTWTSLDYAHGNRRQACLHLGDIVLDRMLAGDEIMKKLVRQQFKSVPRELMLTALAFVDAGLNASRASVKLYIHRNTFNYRLQKFIEYTGLDIRDYHHAFYFRLAHKIILD